MEDRAYAPDILLALVSTAAFGGWGLGGAALISLARHSPIVQDGVAQLRERAPLLLAEARRRAPEFITATPSDRAIAPRPAPGVASSARTAPASRRPRWLEVVNDNPDLTPHALILGGSGVGKTTMATAIMGDRGGRTVVISPKVSAGGWAGAEVVSLDDDGSYAPISAALADLEDEKRRRVVALRQYGPDALEPLTIVMDELVDLTSREPKAGELMVNLSSIGREIKMRLVGIGTTDKALGIKGWASSRNNYVTVQMDQQRRATITHGERTITVPAQDALARARGVSLRPWRGESDPTPIARSVAAEAPRAEVVTMRVPECPDALLSSLMTDLPAEVRAAVPDLSPERAERLARVLGQQQVTVARDGGDVHVSVTQVAASRSARSRRPTVNTKRMKANADKYRAVKTVIADGGSANQAQRAAQVGRAKALDYARRARAELGTGSGSDL